VAHNVHGLHAILETIRRIFKQKPIGLFVMKGDKEIDMVGAAIKNQFEQLLISGAPEWGLLSGSQLSKKLSDVGLKGFEVMEPFEKALDRITKIAKTTNRPTLIFGSHYVAKAIFNKFGFLF
jgi:folylpolyglutamate synthase/dihydropteroate synthase